MLTCLGTVLWAVLLGGPPLAVKAVSLQGPEWTPARCLAQASGRAAGRVLQRPGAGLADHHHGRVRDHRRGRAAGGGRHHHQQAQWCPLHGTLHCSTPMLREVSA